MTIPEDHSSQHGAADSGAPAEVQVRRLNAGSSEVAVFEFEGRLRDMMLENLRHGYLTTGNYTPDAKALSPQGARSLALAGAAAGATAWSAAIAPTLYVATANPATLMTLGQGVGSAVMGAHGIVAQAAFIPVASSLPIVAPILAVQAMTTAVILKQFEQVNKKLDSIKGTLDTAIARSEATLAGELLTASSVVDDVYRQYGQAGSFSTDMLIRLAIAEHDVRRLAERFRYLVNTHTDADVGDIADVQRANYDAHTARCWRRSSTCVSPISGCASICWRTRSRSSHRWNNSRTRSRTARSFGSTCCTGPKEFGQLSSNEKST